MACLCGGRALLDVSNPNRWRSAPRCPNLNRVQTAVLERAAMGDDDACVLRVQLRPIAI
jgi:hypothetical protein